MRFSLLVIAVVLLLSLSALGHGDKCDLSISVYSYAEVQQANRRQLTNLRLDIKGNGIERSLVLAGKTPDHIFREVPSGTYKVHLAKPDFKPRSKDITVRCEIAEDGALYHQIHIWPERGYKLVDSDVVEDALPKKDKGPADASTDRTGKKDQRGSVVLKLAIDEDGNVVSASKLSGKDELAEQAIKMALRSKYSPTMNSGTPQRIEGNMTYNFVP